LNITLYAPVETILGFERIELIKALFILQRCQSPIPLEVLAKAIDSDVADLAALLAPLEREQVGFREGEHLRMVPRSTQITVTGFGGLVPYQQTAAPFEWTKAVVHPSAPTKRYSDLSK
jgi:hypothetical protein